MSKAEPVLVEYQNQHFYKVTEDGKTYYLPSITTKLGVIDKPGLSRWRADIGAREADLRMHEAAQRGTRIHWAWATVLEGGVCVYDPWKNPVFTVEGIADLNKIHNGKVAIIRIQDEMVQLDKLKRQFDILKPQVYGVEKTVYDLENKDAGTIDQILYINKGKYSVKGREPLELEEGFYINDIKTGNYVDDNVWLQLAPYAFMFEKANGVQVQGALVTHTSAKTKSGIPGLTTMFRTRKTLLEEDYLDYRYAAKLWERNHKDDQPEMFEFPAIIELNLKGEK